MTAEIVFNADAAAEEHRAIGRRVTEWIAEYVAALDGARVCSSAKPAELAALFDEPLPREGEAADEILRQFAERVAPHAMNVPSPRYYGLFNPTPLPLAVWADALCSAINQNGAAWRNSPSASAVEERVIFWLGELIGYDTARSFGTLTSGGSEANLVGLKCARDRAHRDIRRRGLRAAPGDLVVYASELGHYSLDKSVDLLGLGRENLRLVETDENYHLKLSALVAQIERDQSEGRIPCCVVGSAGATSNGAVDPLRGMADAAARFGLWFHVDAAYGGALAFSEKHRGQLSGIERADSVTIDPHKWMFVPFACGALLARDGRQILRDSFDAVPAYLSEKRQGGEDVAYDFFRYGQLGTRRFNALKIWMAFKNLGVAGYARVVERQVELTRYFAGRLREGADGDYFRQLGEIETAVCCFRYEPPEEAGAPLSADDANRLQQVLQQRVEASGEAWISSTVLKGRRALRVNVNSFLTERRHVDDLVELIRRESRAARRELSAGQVFPN